MFLGCNLNQFIGNKHGLKAFIAGYYEPFTVNKNRHRVICPATTYKFVPSIVNDQKMTYCTGLIVVLLTL